ncbi:cache domain-containing protein [Sulfurimonas sp. SAG-AH-194-C21]|nr:cache domain-containing protein [Sulfurimonas sp. SAG-AH-194-C21]MDF1883709.1 cache domain-containing protein [Sulfurimonas sp. SAG-AH-194-C21]
MNTKNENLLLKMIMYFPLLLIPTVTLISIIAFYQIYSISFDSNVVKLKKDLLNTRKEILKKKVDNLSQLIVYEKSKIQAELLKRVKERVQRAYEISETIYNEYRDIKSQEEIKDIITTALKVFRWNGNESYIWVMDYSGVHYLIENKKSSGVSFIDFKDAKGRYIVREEIDICQEKTEGFLWDTFTKPFENGDKQYRQVAFVKAFEPYKLCLGSAEFLDTATKKTNKILFDMIGQIDKISQNYVFLFNDNGELLVHNKLPQFVGGNLKTTDSLFLNTFHFLQNSIKGKEEVSSVYEWHNPSTDRVEKKHAYLKRIPNTEWIIGSGFFLSEVDDEFTKQKIEMQQMYNSRTQYIFYIVVVVFFVSLIISFFISRKIEKYFLIYRFHLEEKNIELGELNVSLEEKVKKRTLELETIKDDFEKLATIDALTQISNRYSIMNKLLYEINRSHRYRSSLSILMFDIDNFKDVNDTYGHDIGDKVLVSLARLTTETIRDIDIFGRYGGEEFLIIMPNTLLQDANTYAQRLRVAVQNYHFDKIENLTISIGLVELQSDEDFTSLFKRVDTLLYLSKKNGRNRVSF